MDKLEQEREQAQVKIEADQLSLFDKKNDESYRFVEELAGMNLDELTPMEALNRLYRWKGEVEKSE